MMQHHGQGLAHWTNFVLDGPEVSYGCSIRPVIEVLQEIGLEVVHFTGLGFNTMMTEDVNVNSFDPVKEFEILSKSVKTES